MSMRRPPLPMLALLAACAVLAALGADAPRSAVPAVAKQVSADTAGKPGTIVRNPDGTFTVRKSSAGSGPKTGNRKGLIVVPQVVVPFVPARRAGELKRPAQGPKQHEHKTASLSGST